GDVGAQPQREPWGGGGPLRRTVREREQGIEEPAARRVGDGLANRGKRHRRSGRAGAAGGAARLDRAGKRRGGERRVARGRREVDRDGQEGERKRGRSEGREPPRENGDRSSAARQVGGRGQQEQHRADGRPGPRELGRADRESPERLARSNPEVFRAGGMPEVDDRLAEKKCAETPDEDERAEGPCNQTRNSPARESSRSGRGEQKDARVLAESEQEPARRLQGRERRRKMDPQPHGKSEKNAISRARRAWSYSTGTKSTATSPARSSRIANHTFGFPSFAGRPSAPTFTTP